MYRYQVLKDFELLWYSNVFVLAGQSYKTIQSCQLVALNAARAAAFDGFLKKILTSQKYKIIKS